MYAHASRPAGHRPPAGTSTRPSRAALATRPRVQRVLVRYWEYIRPVRVTVAIIRLLVVGWMAFLGAVLLSAHDAVGWALLAGAVAVLYLSAYVYATAARGWPARDR